MAAPQHRMWAVFRRTAIGTESIDHETIRRTRVAALAAFSERWRLSSERVLGLIGSGKIRVARVRVIQEVVNG